MRSRAWIATFSLLAGSGVSLGRAQEPGERKPEVIIPVTTELVNIDVVVTDKGGRPRLGLTQQDFTVLEDGQPQRIVQFGSFEGLPALASPAASPSSPPSADDDETRPARAVPPRRFVVLVVDDLHLEAGSLMRVKKALDRFLEKEVGPEDQLALVTTSGARPIVQEFTDDRFALRRSVARLSLRDRSAESRGVPHITEYQAERIDRNDGEALRVAVQEIMQFGLFQDEDSAENQARQAARVVLAESLHTARLTLETLDSVVRSLSELPGRRVVALLSDGFLAGLNSASSAAFDIRRISDAGTKAGVVLYALDTRGLVATQPGKSAATRMPTMTSTFNAQEELIRAADEAVRDAMSALAADAGGFLTQNTNDLGAGLRRILKDTENYYLIAYESTNARRDGAFRKVEIRLPGMRDLRVRNRRGYFAPDDRKAYKTPTPPTPETESVREAEARRNAELRNALTSVAPQNGIPVRLSADFVSLEGAGSQIVVTSLVDLKAVPFSRESEHHLASVDAAATVFDESGAIAGTLAPQRADMELSDASYEKAVKNGLQYQQAAGLKPGRYRVRFAVREDGGGRLGSASQWVRVPDLTDGKLALSSLFLMKKEEDKTAAPVAEGPEPVALRGVQALRRFSRDESLYVQLYAYNPKRDSAGGTSLVTQAEVWRKGALLASSSTEPMADEGQKTSVAHTRSIKLTPVEPGEYEIRVVVTDQNANQMISRRAAFTIE